MKKITGFIFILLLLLAGCGPAKSTSGADVVQAFKDAGLEAESASAMTKDDYGFAPYVCTGTRFLIPSLGEDSGGRVFVCDNTKDQEALAGYYTELGRSSAVFFSWVFTKGNVVVQINGSLPEETARKYESAIP